MSASLVGSEMCIRDSPLALPEERLPAARSPRPRPTKSGWGLPPLRRAVSYTHLTLPTICSV
eukprot:8613178-Alexandrium_andersonii.AAC.1